MPRRSLGLASLWLACAACGGGSPSGPSGVPSPTPTPAGTVALDVLIYYDQNGDGARSAGEVVRLPEVRVIAAGQASSTGSDGVATLQVPAGTQAVEIDGTTLPPYYRSPGPIPVTASVRATAAAATAEIPVTLDIGNNQPNVYMAFGDSITDGDGSSDGRGYRGVLEQRLRERFGAASIINDGVPGTRSNQGAARIEASLIRVRPAFTLIHYGVNDWNQRDCQFNLPTCFTVASLRTMLEETRTFRSLTFMATILPANTFFDARTPPQRNDWVRDTSRELKQLAVEFGVVIVDLEGRFWLNGPPDKQGLYFDHVHPNDTGYQIIADTFFEAIVHGRPGVLPPEVPRFNSFGFSRH